MNDLVSIPPAPLPRVCLGYVLITPARNEAAFIEQTIRAMTAQTVLPIRWVIVSDGSTDGTDEIVRRYLADHPWIELLRMPERAERHFGGKVRAFNAGLARVADLNYQVIGNLDADVTFEADYLEFLLGKFAENPRLGVAGTNRWEGKLMYDYRYSSSEDVAGACQLFRRECFEAVGGYKPVKAGGVDLVAMLTARMRGWETRSFSERILIHHRPTGTATASGWLANYQDGRKDYLFGGHPLWELFRGAYRMTRRPYLVGGVLLLCGYFFSMVKRLEKPVPAELIRFRRGEQMHKLKAFLSRPFRVAGAPAGAPVVVSGKSRC